jgi:hypothetical protein
LDRVSITPRTTRRIGDAPSLRPDSSSSLASGRFIAGVVVRASCFPWSVSVEQVGPTTNPAVMIAASRGDAPRIDESRGHGAIITALFRGVGFRFQNRRHFMATLNQQTAFFPTKHVRPRAA